MEDDFGSAYISPVFGMLANKQINSDDSRSEMKRTDKNIGSKKDKLFY